MARPDIATIRTLGDFQKTYMWEMSITKSPNGVNISTDEMNYRMISTDVPKRTGQTSTLMMRGFQIFDPGIYAVGGQLNLTFLETVDATIQTWIQEWEEALYKKAVSFSQLYADFSLMLLDNQGKQSYKYDLLYCFLEDSTINTLDGGTSDPMQPSITLRYMDMRRSSSVSSGNPSGGGSGLKDLDVKTSTKK